MIGASMVTKGGVAEGLTFAASRGCTAAQLYVGPSRAWALPPTSPVAAALFRDRYAQGPLATIVAHGSLLLNVASSNEEIRGKSIERLVAELQRCRLLGITQLVLHPGSNPDHAEGVRLAVGAIDVALEQTVEVKILVENMAGQGNTLGATFEQLAEVVLGVSDSSRVGVCIDTCHAFAAGYDIRGSAGYARGLKAFERCLPMSTIGAFHVNDSKVECGRRVDRHADCVGEGHIGIEFFASLLSDGRFVSVPMIAEPPNGEITTARNVEIMAAIRAGQARSETTLYQQALL